MLASISENCIFELIKISEKMAQFLSKIINPNYCSIYNLLKSLKARSCSAHINKFNFTPLTKSRSRRILQADFFFLIPLHFTFLFKEDIGIITFPEWKSSLFEVKENSRGQNF